MKIIDDLISTLTREAPVKDVRQGPFQTAVLTQSCGMASTPHDYSPHHDTDPVQKAGWLLGKEALELARMSYSVRPHEAAIGMATINSLLEVDERHCTEINAGDLLAEKGRGKRVALIGHFPFVPKLRQEAKELWVIERHLQEGDIAESEAESLVPQAAVVGITGTAFSDHTIERLLNLCHPKAYVVVLGGTAPLSPVLFDYGVNAISGTIVCDPDTVLRCVTQGATFRQIKATEGIRLLTLEKM